MIRARDWAGHPLGPPGAWPAAFRAALSLVLNSPESMILAWGPDLHFFFNDTYFPLLGPRLAWAMGERFDRVWADAWDQAKPIIDEAFAGRSTRFVDLPWKLDTDRGPADTWWSFSYSRVLDGDGAVAGLFIFTNETTPRVRADAALRESQRRLEQALAEVRSLNATLEQRVEERTAERDRLWETSPDLLLIIDFDGIFRRVNPSWTTLLGYAPSELVGRHVTAFVLAEDHAETVSGYVEAAAGGKPRVVNRYRHRDGSLRWISWTAAPAGTLTYATGRDITAERERAEALLKAEEQLRQAQKMEAVGQLTGGLAHDFNNLLAGISGSLELMRARMGQGRVGDVERYMAAAQGASTRAAALTHRLLAFSRRQTLDPRPTDVNRLVAGMEEMIRRTVGPGIPVAVVADPGIWPALVDPSQLENALLNLCINARDAMPDGGRITIETANAGRGGAAAPPSEPSPELPPGQYLSLSVTDTGTGMPPEVIARAFEPFFTTKPIGEGTGLGLSMIYGFAQQSGGGVRIASRVGHGTTVSIDLPRHHGAVGEDGIPERGPALPRSDQGETVLIVDDEPTVRMLVADILEDLGYRAIEAGDSAEGLRVLQSDARIDLLVTDVGLPGGMNGRQMADAARGARPELKVLFITGYAENAFLGDAALAPGTAVLTKPFAVDAMAARIRAMIEGGAGGRGPAAGTMPDPGDA